MFKQQRKSSQYQSRQRLNESPHANSQSENTNKQRDATSDNYLRDSLIADMAKGFVEAQAKINNSPQETSNTEILQLLNKISQQLNDLKNNEQKSESAGQKSGSLGQQNQNQGSNSFDQNSSASKPQSTNQQKPSELQALFSQLLSSANSASATGQKESQPQQVGGDKEKKIPAQMAAQALTQAQYELSQELEASLQKLKQVIAESENLANRIQSLTDNNNNNSQSS